MSKPVLSLKKKKAIQEATPEEIPVNPIAVIEVVEWDYTPEEEFAPRQRKRRKDRQVEQYRKEAKWQ
jgi:hypothetical protein